MRNTIEEMRILNFRGIRDLHLPVKGQNLIIVGENGSGKSSIIDAIEYGLQRSVKKLTGRMDVDESKGIPFLKKDDVPTVSLSVSAGQDSYETVTVTYPFKRTNIAGSVEPFFTMAAEQSFILRRSQILGFIEAKGSERYEKVSHLIGLGALETIDGVWADKLRELKREIDHLTTQHTGSLQAAAGELSARAKDEQALLQEINASLKSIGLPAIDQIGELEKALEEFQRELTSDHKKSESLTELRRLQQYCLELETQWAAVVSALEASSTAHTDYYQRLTTLDGATLEKFLIHGRQFLQEHLDQHACPLCESELDDLTELLQRLDERLERLAELTESRRVFDQERKNTTSNLDTYLARLRDLEKALEPIRDNSLVDQLQGAIKEAEEWKRAVGSAADAPPPREAISRHSALARLQTSVTTLKEQVHREISDLTQSEAVEQRLQKLFCLQRVLQHWNTANKLRCQLAGKRHVYERFELIYDRLTKARKNGIDQIQQSITRDVERLYRMLHPDDARVSVNLPIHSRYKRSISMTTSFYDDEAHPLNYYSEGHLDSMGLCIFLAFIARYSKDLKLIVLDDVLTTIDSGHRIRVARLLAREFKDSQIIITTHDRLWAEQLHKALPNSRVTRLKPWNLETGTECLEYIPTWEYYRRQAHNGRPQDAIAGTGRTFEKFLFEMRGRLRLAIPARPDEDYTIGDMYGPFFKWVARYAPERHDRPDFTEEIRALEERLNEVWRLRNWSGAHFNPWGEAVSANDALSFIDEIEQLTCAFECPRCTSLVVYNEIIGVLHCPECRPSPPPRIVWQYRPGWGEAQMRKLTRDHEAARKGAVIESQRALVRFLRDARRRYGFVVRATPDDTYEIDALYAPFSEWVARRNLPSIEAPAIAVLVESIGAYLLDGRWQPVPADDRCAFVDAIVKLTGAFHCPDNDCGHLYDYDADRGQFICPRENGNEPHTAAQGALWYVKQG